MSPLTTSTHAQGAADDTGKAPLISVVTINFNGGPHLADTLRSVATQRFEDFEYIVVDGGSTDGSLDLVRSFEGAITRWISEPDEGIADAMNKGLRLARGRHVLFLHSDDYLLAPDSLESAAAYLDDDVDIHAFDIVFGGAQEPKRMRPRGLGAWLYLKTGIFHQACFCTRRSFERIGYFDTSYRIAMDYDWFLRAKMAGLSYRYCAAAFSFMRDSGVSSQTDTASLRKRFEEERRIHISVSGHPVRRAFYRLYWSLYPAYRGVSR